MHGVALDDLVAAPTTADPRVHLRPVQMHDMTVIPLSQRRGGLQAYKMLIPSRGNPERPALQTHDGHEWFYVLDGRLRLILGDQDLVLGPGEAAEFDARTPHWNGSADEYPVEILALVGKQGERAHLRARV